MAYIITRYVKLSVQRPVVLCHGVRLDAPLTGAETEVEQLAMIDRVNAACLAADGDGWHYWCWTDDWQSSLAHLAEQKADPVACYFQGESMGLYDYDDHPRPVVPLVCNYSAELQRRAQTHGEPKKSQTLLLSSATKMYTLFRRMSTAHRGGGERRADAAGRGGGLPVDEPERCAHQRRRRWTAIKLIVLADNMYSRDYRELPEMLLSYVEHGGTLYFAMDQFDAIEDEYGVRACQPGADQTLRHRPERLYGLARRQRAHPQLAVYLRPGA